MALFGKKDKKTKEEHKLPEVKGAHELGEDEMNAVTGGVKLTYENIYGDKNKDGKKDF